MLYLVSTPIGNLEDITLRAMKILQEADVILAEDTRHTGMLLKHFQVPHKPLISFYDQVEDVKMLDILESARTLNVALVSDAGTPLISDPGYKLVREALKMGVKVQSIPGPNAAVTALTISGLPPDKFMFLGYPPEKESHQKELIEKIFEMQKIQKFTVIFYISPHKIGRFLKNLPPDLNIVVARELTKVYEEVWRGTVVDAQNHFQNPKGEFVLLF